MIRTHTQSPSRLAALAGVAVLLLTATQASALSTNALDVAANYSSFSGNQGFGFGPWTLNTPGGGSYIANDGGTHPRSFGLWNNTADSASTANRPFTAPLSVGGSFSCDFLLNNLDSTFQTNGFQLQDAGGSVLFSYFHTGGDNADGHYTDANGEGAAIGFGYNFQRFVRLEFNLNTATTYTFTSYTNGVMEATFNGTITEAPVTQVTFVRGNGAPPAPGNGQDFKFDSLMLTSPTGTVPQFDVQPQTLAVFERSTLSLSANAIGSPAVSSYQWYFNDSAMSSKTANNLTIDNVGQANGGSYYLVAGNSMGLSTSAVAVVTVLPFGYTNAFDVAANYSGLSGNRGFGFEPWTVSTAGGGSYITGGSTPVFGLWNTAASSSSTANRPFSAPLSVGSTFMVQMKMNSLDFSDNQNGFNLQDGSGNILFSFWHQGGDIADGNFMDLNGMNVAPGFAYDYQQMDSYAFVLTTPTTYKFINITRGVSITGALASGPITQVTFFRSNVSAPNSNGQDFHFNNLAVISPTAPAPGFVLQPVSTGGLVGETVSLRAAATSSQPVTYQWYKGAAAVSGATGTNLVITNIALSDADSYWVVAANASGSATSAVAVISAYVRNNAILGYEGFAYDDAGGGAAMDGATQNGGIGWTGPWQIVSGSGNYINPGSLSGGVNVPAGYDSRSLSNSYYNFGSSRIGRALDVSTNGLFAKRGYLNDQKSIGADGKTIYISFLMQPPVAASFYEFEFHRGELGDAGRIAGIGNDNGTATDVFLRAGSFQSLGAEDAAVSLYVVRIDYKDGNDDVRVYRNPTTVTEPETPTLTAPAVANMAFDGISIGAWGNNVGVDEIRIGATWEDVMGTAVSNALRPVKVAQGWRVRFAATPGFTYHVERAPSVNGPWSDIGTVVCPDNGLCEFTDSASLTTQAFYRSVRP